MKYKATIIINGNYISKDFPTIAEAAQWLDSENNNYDSATLIETFDNTGNRKDSFYYTEAPK